MTKQDTDARGGQTERDPRIWELVPVADYRLPPTPAAQAAQARWVSLKRLFAGQRHEHEAPVRAEADLRRLPEQQLDALVATINWGPGAKVLQRALETWDADNAVHFLIAPPRSGQVELLRRWATENGARWIDPPKYQDILEAGPAWLAGWPSDASHWVLTRLEHCWLRHPAGLALIRQLLDRALSGRLGRGVIDCDSWAWAYLRYVAPLPTPSAMTLQAFDGKHLAALLRDLVTWRPRGTCTFAMRGPASGSSRLMARTTTMAAPSCNLSRHATGETPDSPESSGERACAPSQHRNPAPTRIRRTRTRGRQPTAIILVELGVVSERLAAILRKDMDPEADSYSGLHNNVGPNGRRAPTGLAGYLRERRIDPVVCCGLARDVCVKWTAQDAAAAGLRSLFIWDLTWPVDADNDDATRAELVVKEVEVVTAEALLTSFRRAAGGAHDSPLLQKS